MSGLGFCMPALQAMHQKQLPPPLPPLPPLPLLPLPPLPQLVLCRQAFQPRLRARGPTPRLLAPVPAYPQISYRSRAQPPAVPAVPQLSLQYRVAQDRLYEAFYSMDDPQAQVTSYGTCPASHACGHAAVQCVAVDWLLKLRGTSLGC